MSGPGQVSVTLMTVTKATQTRASKGHSSEMALAKEPATCACILAEMQRRAEEWESFTAGQGEALLCPDGVCWPEEALRG